MSADRGMAQVLWEHRECSCAERGAGEGEAGFTEEVGLS